VLISVIRGEKIMDLEKKFRKFISEKKLFAESGNILLAVSGGVDSVVMTELFSKAGISFGIAHCNFQLRNDESEADEVFVKKLAEKYSVPFFSKRFETKKKSGSEKLTVQEKARQQRYEWFGEIIREKKFDYVATAHHLNDSIETFFINLLRGTGISGLRGIPLKIQSPPTIRPMLFALKKEIEDFAEENKLSFTLDHSNETDLYFRNKLRHHLMPVLLQLNPQFEKVMERNLRNLSFAEEMMKESFAELIPGIKDEEENEIIIKKVDFEGTDYPAEMLTAILHSYGFNFSQAEDAWAASIGSRFFAGDNILTVDRGKFILGKKNPPAEKVMTISSAAKNIKSGNLNLSLKSKKLRAGSTLPGSENKDNFILDKQLLNFPLTVRRWRQGDAFYPLGMKGRKKISDFLTDRKVSRPDKEKTYVLLSGNEIVCVLGHRIDERYKVTDRTKEIYQIELNNG
jgi:tRNA(Ile)-lysidine synthase